MPSTDITYCTREEIIKAIKKLGEIPAKRPSIEEMENNIELCKKSIKINWEDVKEWGKTMLDKKVFDEVVSLLMEGKEIEEFEHQGYMLNRDKKHVKLIVIGLKNKERYCPCRVEKTDENICCCTDFIENGHCCCGLWVKKEE